MAQKKKDEFEELGESPAPGLLPDGQLNVVKSDEKDERDDDDDADDFELP